LVEWQTKRLAEVIGSTVAVPKGKKNPLEKLVKNIKLFPDPEPETKEPQPGSAERFAGQFGQVLDRG